MEKFKTEKNDYLGINSKVQIRQEGMRTQLEWIKRQLEYASFSEKYLLRYDLKRGEIYEFDWGLNVNAEFSNRHFGVVLADSDIFNPLVTVCPLKSKHGECNPKSDIDLGIIKELGTYNSTVAVINQVRTIDKLRIYLRRIIGIQSGSRIADENNEEEYTILRLENDKLNMILEAYSNYLSGKNLKWVVDAISSKLVHFIVDEPSKNVWKSQVSTMLKNLK